MNSIPPSPETSDTGARRNPRRLVAFRSSEGLDQVTIGEFLRSSTVGGALMLAAAVLALLVANLAPDTYHHLQHIQIGPLDLHGWAADGLLTIFFLVAGMELKREFVEGSLSRPADALLPIMAAVGGMALPAGLYVAVNTLLDGDLGGWAIPMATDIAFALAVLAIVGRNLPGGLRAFLLTLAIVDDLGAILVIAVFFSHGLDVLSLLASLACVAVYWLLQRRRFDLGGRWRVLVFVALGVAAWWLMLSSGVHATIAGVLVGLATRVSELEEHDPVTRWLHHVEPWSAGLVVPLFAFFSAGVAMDGEMLRRLVAEPEPLGILLGLLLGKFVGVLAASWLTARLTSAELAPGVTWADVAALSIVTGVGFTVSLLMADLAFADPATAEGAKAAVLVASLTAAVVAGFALRRRNNHHARTSSTGTGVCP
ncbi:Na+/H+ antiporter NhaA [Luteococcus peritonei]